MTRDEKQRMLLHPERYTDEQLDGMLNETDIPMPDIDTEWQKFEAEHFNQKHRSRGWMQIAAMFIGALLLSGIAYAAVHVISNIESKPKVTITDSKPDVKKVKKSYGLEVGPTKRVPVINNNVELQQIMQYIADVYDVNVEFKNEAARTLRFYLQWETDDTLQEIIDKINHFKKVHLTLTDETITVE
ncbi:MAG: DUF4974 domain-containing protein [Prevotella sp.]|nr:DUF4974 domain-containing protein [Prevotella sp.]